MCQLNFPHSNFCIKLDTIWNVEEHRYTKEDNDKTSIEKELFSAELIPEAPTNLSFLEKFLELQIKMLITNQENVQNHNYASDPTEWPFMTRGIAYFISKTSNVMFKIFSSKRTTCKYSSARAHNFESWRKKIVPRIRDNICIF